jgi:hypothetical protein
MCVRAESVVCWIWCEDEPVPVEPSTLAQILRYRSRNGYLDGTICY